MPVLLLVARLFLAAVFITAGVAKLTDRRGSEEALRSFGVPGPLATPLAVLLPLAELAVAIALIPNGSARWGALAAFALLLVFAIGIGANLALGRRPDCHCFGQLHIAPLGWTTLVRNVLLGAIAGFVVWQGWDEPGASATNWMGQVTVVEAVALVVAMMLVVLVALEGWLLLNLLRQHGRLLVRLDSLEGGGLPRTDSSPGMIPRQPPAGLPVGTPAPDFHLTDVDGEIVTLGALRGSRKPMMLLFTDPACGPCVSLMPEIARWQQDHTHRLIVALVSSGTVEANRVKAHEHRLTHVLVQESREIAEAYGGAATPSAVVVDSDGRIAAPVAAGAEAIRSLLRRTVESPAPLPMLPYNAEQSGDGSHHDAPSRPGHGVGAPAPGISLPDLSGKTIEFAKFRDHDTLVVFWNPSCGFCQQMLPDLKALDAKPPKGGPKLVVVSSGSLDANKAMNLRSPVLLDATAQAMRAFGAHGTPMAVLINRNGTIASGLAAGAPAVLALAASRQSPPPAVNTEPVPSDKGLVHHVHMQSGSR